MPGLSLVADPLGLDRQIQTSEYSVYGFGDPKRIGQVNCRGEGVLLF
jgi:hypothetical protein